MNTHPTLLALALALAAGCSKDANPDPMMRDVIIETGYVECVAPGDDCAGIAQCTEANDAQICVQAPADECTDALTCDCVGAWVCGDLPCVDIDGGFACGDDPAPQPEPPAQECLRVEPATLDFGNVQVSDQAELSLRVVAECATRLRSIALLDGTDEAFSLLEVPLAPMDLAAGESLDLAIVRVAPTEPGLLTGAVRVNDDPALHVDLTANAMRPIGGNCLEANPQQIDFGVIPIGQTAQRVIQLAANCDGVLTSAFTHDTGDINQFTLASPVDGPVQAGEGTELVIEVTANAEGEIRGSLNLSGVGAPISIPLTAQAAAPAPDCNAEGVGCLGGLVCSRAGQCVPQTRFIITQDDDTPAFYLQIWPNDLQRPHLVIESADNEFTAFNPGNIFEPCDACGAAPDCAEQPATVIDAALHGPIVWDGTWWLSDTPDGDDCARPQQIVDGLFTARLCGSFEVELTGEPADDGSAPGLIGESRCMPATEFDVAAGGDVVVNIESE